MRAPDIDCQAVCLPLSWLWAGRLGCVLIRIVTDYFTKRPCSGKEGSHLVGREQNLV